MPFKSEAQRRFLYGFHPEIAKEFESKTKEGADLPEKIGSQSAQSTKRARLEAMRRMSRKE